MKTILNLVGNTTAILGIILCLVTGILRLSGQYEVVGFEAMTLFNAGTALMVMACLAKLEQMARL